MEALIFDCDGVLVDTERDGHRVAFNRAFATLDLPFEWSVEEYGELLKIAGGKERMRSFFEKNRWPIEAVDRDALIKRLHQLKTDYFIQLIESGELPVRSGINRIVDEAYSVGVQLAVCSTSNERAVIGVVRRLLGLERYAKFAGIFAGDVVARKKPDPAIYQLAVQRLQLDPTRCLVVEDSHNGLVAANRAGIACLITPSTYTMAEDFDHAVAVYPELGDPPAAHVTLNDLQRHLQAGTPTL
jgi:HAD superfamily hydrolase (TIGR01509 family)